MNNFQFINYLPTPNDQYMLGVAEILAYGKIILRFKHVNRKDGTGTFFCTSNYTIQDSMAEKKFLSCVDIDSRIENEILQEIIRKGVAQKMANMAANQATIAQIQVQPAYYPNGTTRIAEPPQSPPTSMSEVAAEEQIPF